MCPIGLQGQVICPCLSTKFVINLGLITLENSVLSVLQSFISEMFIFTVLTWVLFFRSVAIDKQPLSIILYLFYSLVIIFLSKSVSFFNCSNQSRSFLHRTMFFFHSSLPIWFTFFLHHVLAVLYHHS